MSPHCGHRTTTFQMYAFFHIITQGNESIISPGWFRPIVFDDFFFYKNTSRSPGLFRLHLISFSHYPSCVIGFSRYVNSFSLISFLPSRRQSEFSRSLRLPNVDILTVFLWDLLIFAPRRKAKSRGGTLVTRAYLQLKYTVIQSI